MRKVKNFARFYACLNSVQTVDKEDTKQSLVYQFTGGRTTSLREMSTKEYDAMCDSIDPKMERTIRETAEIKAHRSAVLKRLQKLGVDTTDWNAVDRFCLDNRIAGKKFYNLTIEELDAMIPKLIAIAKKPKGRGRRESPQESEIIEDDLQHSTPVMSNAQIDFIMQLSKNRLPS